MEDLPDSPGMGETIQEMLDRDPFIPFTLVMNSGDRYQVKYAQLTVIGKSLLTIARPHTNGHDVLRLTEISSLETMGLET